MTQDHLLEAIDGMTVLELSEFIKKFEERYGVTPRRLPRCRARLPALPPVVLLRPLPRSRASSALS